MLGGENHVFHSRAGKDLGPLLRIEFYGVELIAEPKIPLLVILVYTSFRPPYPVLVANAPGFNYSWHGVDSPVHQHAKLKVLPSVKFLEHSLICRPLVAICLFYNILPILSKNTTGKQNCNYKKE